MCRQQMFDKCKVKLEHGKEDLFGFYELQDARFRVVLIDLRLFFLKIKK
jgi:hypothetical protein